MKVLTVWQPWASLIAVGAKPYEFRSWATPGYMVGQRGGIHAGARPIKRDEVGALLTELLKGRYWTACLKPELAVPLLELALATPERLPLSAVLCTALFGEARNGHDIAAEFGMARVNDSTRDEHANWGWPLTDIDTLIPPIEARGAQGLWNWSGA